MKAVKRPIPIDVQEFQPDQPIKCIIRKWNDGWEVFNKLHGSWIGIKPGDVVNVTDPDDTYPIDRATFDRTYQVLDSKGVVNG